MIIFYNIFQLAGLILFLPVLFVKTIISPKYRGRIPQRLGIGLGERLQKLPAGRQRIWIHALSVGEVLSSRPLLQAIRKSYPEATILYSAATRTGEELAIRSMKHQVDMFVPYPLDLAFIVKRFIALLRPDLFILVETDFWPNFLHSLGKAKIPALLVNGRISQKSFARYHRLRLFFLPLFSSFRFISMQTAADAEMMVRLGVPAERVRPLGNLKYDAVLPLESVLAGPPYLRGSSRREFGIPEGRIVWIAGSTHGNEEITILTIFKRLSLLFPDLFLVLAPRQPSRSGDISELAKKNGLTSRRRSKPVQHETEPATPLLILDTMGELSSMYSFCDIAFIGGSLVPDGGHNPLEPAAFGKPVLFGPHMDDFTEISRDMLETGAAMVVQDGEELFEQMRCWLTSTGAREKAGAKGRALVEMHAGVTRRHLEILGRFLDQFGRDENGDTMQQGRLFPPADTPRDRT